jgi:hypothetical protein
MPALGGDSAYAEGVELHDRDILRSGEKVHYPGRYVEADADTDAEISIYEAVFDQLVNETLHLVREVLRVERPRAPAVYWDAVLGDLRANTDDDPACHALIVDLAESLAEPLEHVTSHPKRTLKRIRDQQRVQMVQEIDMHCLIDLARRPGSTMPEKAGPKQRVLAVTRQENVDLLENRVARHCCELLRRAAGRYLRAHQHVGASKRKQRVAKAFRDSKRLTLKPMVSAVGRLASPCRQPNYVLLQNIHYARIWDGYSRLVRNEELRDVLWRWPRRLWMDRVGVYVADTIIGWAEQSRFPVCVCASDRLVQAMSHHACGAWLLPDVMPGPFIVGKNSADIGTLHIIDNRTANVLDERFAEAAVLCADFAAFWVKGATVRVLPIYATWPSPCEGPSWEDGDRARIAEDVLESIALFNQRSQQQVVAVGALVVDGLVQGGKRDAPCHTASQAHLTCWQVGLRPDVGSWPTESADRYRPIDVLIEG